MIVRDEQANLGDCLESCGGLFDEIVVTDTGSTDATIKIARRFGARVFEFAWIDDFSAARNFGLDRARGDWIFWMDADDRIDPPNREKLEALLGGLRPDVAVGFQFWHVSLGPAPLGPPLSAVEQVRLFVRSGTRFLHRCHEQAVPSRPMELLHTGIVIDHHGYMDPEVCGLKRERNRRLLELDLASAPDETYALHPRMHLGIIAHTEEDWRACIGHITPVLRASRGGGDMISYLHLLIGEALSAVGDRPLARESFREGLAAGPTNRVYFDKLLAGYDHAR